jgi:hypothetical protein
MVDCWIMLRISCNEFALDVNWLHLMSGQMIQVQHPLFGLSLGDAALWSGLEQLWIPYGL